MTPPPRPHVRLVRATTPLLEALQQDSGRFANLLRSPPPAGWPEFPEAIDFTLSRLREDEASPWWMHLFLDADSGLLVGSGGYAGPPADGRVEIGYEVAPEHRGRGYGRAAASALVRQAGANVDVTEVVAHTLPGPNPSTGVLTSLGFTHAGEREDPDEGTIWAWSLSLVPSTRWARSSSSATDSPASDAPG